MDKLIQMFRQREEIPVVMAHIVQHCHHKVCTRLRRVAAAFKINVHGTSNIFGIEQDSADHQHLEANLREKGYLLPTSTLIEALDRFVVRASNAMPNTPVDDLLPVMAFAFGLMTEEEIPRELIKDKVVRRIRKVSDYYRTCGAMRALIEKRQGHEINHLQVFCFFSAILLFLDLELANFVMCRFFPTLQRSAPSLSADTLWTH